MEMLGRAQRAAVFKERTTMIATGDHEEEVNKRIAQVKAEGQATDSEFDREKAEERVAKLGGAIGRIKVGAATETELKDKKLRYEDALNSVKAAMDEGIVPGGGSTLVYMLRYKQQILDAMESDDEKLAVDILFRAIQVRLWSRPTSLWSRPTSPPLRPASDPATPLPRDSSTRSTRSPSTPARRARSSSKR